jgi:hypothetical protein
MLKKENFNTEVLVLVCPTPDRDVGDIAETVFSESREV